jgi:glycosyltransferase involved in cell wall biosynthesis
MRIGLDGFPLSLPKTGVGHYTFELARSLAQLAPQHQFELISRLPYPPDVISEIDSIENLIGVNPPTNPLTRRWWSIGLPRYLKHHPVDLFHGKNYELHLWNGTRNVLTVHDLSVFTVADKHERKIARRARRRFPIMIRAAAAIITPTQAVKQELSERFKIDPGRITVTPEAPRTNFRPMVAAESELVRKRLGIDDEFILFVGTIEPRKNLLTLLRAFDRILKTTNQKTQLVIAGGEGWLRNDLHRFLREADFGDRLRMTGYLDDEDLRALYSSCTLFVYPSLYEGFGLPPLEAMACGAPVIASRIPALVETLSDKATLVDPGNEIELASAIVGLLNDEKARQALSAAGLNHAAKFSWAETARRTFEVYESVLSGRGPLNVVS